MLSKPVSCDVDITDYTLLLITIRPHVKVIYVLLAYSLHRISQENIFCKKPLLENLTKVIGNTYNRDLLFVKV